MSENLKKSALFLFFRKVCQVLKGVENCFENVIIVPPNSSKISRQNEQSVCFKMWSTRRYLGKWH